MDEAEPEVEPALTGQVPVTSTGTNCPNHRMVEHGTVAGGARYCNSCGRDENGNAVAPPNGGWGTRDQRGRN